MEHLEMNLHLWHNIKMDVKERCFDFRLNSSFPHGGVGKVGFLEKLMPLFYMKAVKIFKSFALEIFSGRIQINYFP